MVTALRAPGPDVFCLELEDKSENRRSQTKSTERCVNEDEESTERQWLTLLLVCASLSVCSSWSMDVYGSQEEDEQSVHVLQHQLSCSVQEVKVQDLTSQSGSGTPCASSLLMTQRRCCPLADGYRSRYEASSCHASSKKKQTGLEQTHGAVRFCRGGTHLDSLVLTTDDRWLAANQLQASF
ncbi:hypothetical protein EYF80_057534 [Liparis tanakae]|uniref:Uncharacterized protein n=1 Tax=Liparis tanakae TaxID=230148 RepID=A0A4Z2EU40_9TELE|nr:hypothetical protein EYF80_057534 [Liparis tanakae]